jgi:RNA polymerase sigma-70 factor (ECF subfamily)
MPTGLDEKAARRRRWTELMGRVQQGDRDAYRTLLEEIERPLVAFLRRRVGEPADVEDVYQDTLIALHRARHTHEPGRPLEPWLFAIARNVAIDHARRRRTRRDVEVLVDELPDREAEPAAAGAERLAEALARLPPAQRQAFELLQLRGLSIDEGAARAGTTPGAFKVRAHRAYTALRAYLGGR